ncbi:hypothetical protein LTR08_000975 [Meristemomyces frigidus]|nr:hypothetical protein LTR08_000975 [Meristemomyces frigidus]
MDTRRTRLPQSTEATHRAKTSTGMNALNILPSYTDYFSLTTGTLALNTPSIWLGSAVSDQFYGQIVDLIREIATQLTLSHVKVDGLYGLPYALDAIGRKTYMMNGAWDVLQLVFELWCWVETAGKTLKRSML